jgi:hypothetical protein
MVEVEAEIGTHTITWTLEGYETLKATVDVTDKEAICLNVFSDTKTGTCYGALETPKAPGVKKTASFTLFGYLSPVTITPPAKFTSYEEWLGAKGGAKGIYRNSGAVLEIIDAYLGFIDLGFTVTSTHVFKTVDYYLGI